MRTILTALMLFCALVCANAQTDLKNMTEQEFRKQKQEYLIKELALTQEEAKEFFPLYEKFQKEKKQIYDENQSLMDRADIAGEEEYRQIINRLLDLQIMSDELDVENEVTSGAYTRTSHLYLPVMDVPLLKPTCNLLPSCSTFIKGTMLSGA